MFVFWFGVGIGAEGGEAVGLCAAGERVVFECTVSGGKHISLCETASGLQYRFGREGEIELRWPSGPSSTDAGFTLERRAHARSASFVARFVNEGITYEVYDQLTLGSELDHGAGVIVSRGETRLAELRCALDQPLVMHLDSLVEADQPSPSQ